MARGATLIGRDAELAVIHESIVRAGAGSATCLLVLGEAGIGKTRLLEAAADEARARGLRTLTGSAIESGAGLPFLALMAPLATVDEPGRGDPASRAVHRLVRGDAAPDAERSDDTGDASDIGSAARLVESIFQVIARRPTALIVDDVHWADSSTLTVLDHLGHRARDVPLLVLAAARDDESRMLDRLPFADDRRYRSLRLGRLDRDSIVRQVSGLLGADPDRALVDYITRRSAGNPLFVEQLLAAGATEPDAEGHVPATLRVLVERRIERLSSPTRHVLEALAVLGRPAGRALLAATADVPDAACATAIDDATSAGIVSSSPDGVDLRHPLFREVVEGRLDRGRSAVLHARAAVHLEELGAPDTEVAGHWWRSEDRHRAWESALAAGSEAEAALAFGPARIHLEHAIDAWPDGDSGLDDVALRASRAAWVDGDAAGALAIVRAVAPRVPATVALLVAQGGYEWDAGERAASTATFERIAALLDDSVTGSERSAAVWGLGRARVSEGHFVEAAALALEAARVAAAAEDPTSEAEALMLFAMARAFDGSVEGIEALERGIRLAERVGAPSPTGHGYQFLVDLLESSGRPERALDVALRGIEASERLGVAGFHGADLRGRAGLILLDLGRWDDAATVLEPSDPRAFPSLARGILAARRGNDVAACEAFDAAAVGGAIGGPGSLGGWLEIGRAEAAWTRGDLRSAEAALDARRPVPGIWAPPVDGRAAWWRARIRIGSAGDAEIEAARRVPEPRLAAALVADIEAMRAEMDRDRGPAGPREVVDRWASAAVAWGDAERPYERAYARLRESLAAFEGGERGRARAALHEATEIARDLQARPLESWALDLARRARVRPTEVKREGTDPDAMTARERDVLELLAEGLTNRSIGERLFISPKTAEVHISRILAKLGARTRGEAVAIARRSGLLGDD